MELAASLKMALTPSLYSFYHSCGLESDKAAEIAAISLVPAHTTLRPLPPLVNVGSMDCQSHHFVLRK
eukprot:364163-Karenia_brevis.AAC.1